MNLYYPRHARASLPVRIVRAPGWLRSWAVCAWMGVKP